MKRLSRRTVIAAAGVVAASLLAPADGARAASAANGPWIVTAFSGIYQVDRRAPDPPVKLLDYGRAPAASPDGRHIAFTYNQTPFPVPASNLFLYDRRTGAIQQVTHNTDRRMSFFWPTYAPDGRRVAVVHQDKLFIVDLATGALTLRVEGRPVSKPAWSPDGRSIAFCTLDDAGLQAIYLVRVGSGRLQKVISGQAGESLTDPVWAPDSRRLLFTTSRWAPTGSDILLLDIGEVEPDGSDLRRLTDQSRYYESPVFSPDGQKVAVLSIPPENTEPDGGNILVFPADFSRHWWVPGDELDDSDRLSWAPPAA